MEELKAISKKCKKDKKILFTVSSIENKRDVEIFEYKKSLRIIDFLQKEFPQGKEGKKFNIILNGKEIDIKDSDIRVKKGDIINIILTPKDIVTILINIAIMIAVSYVMSKLFPMPKAQIDGIDDNYESTYTTGISQIQAKKNGSIQMGYGNIRMFPNRICPIFKRYVHEETYVPEQPGDLVNPTIPAYYLLGDSEEYTYLTTILGLGDYDINSVYVEDSKIEDFGGDITYEVFSSYNELEALGLNYRNKSGDDKYRYIAIEPAEYNAVTLQEDYQEIGYYTINDRFTKIDKIEVDISFQGLYTTTDSGGFASQTQYLQITIQQIDDNENDIGGAIIYNKNVTGNSKKVYRLTEEIEVPPGRYKVKIKRNSASSGTDAKVADNFTVDRIKGFLVEDNDMFNLLSEQDLTAIVFKIKSSASVSAAGSLKINVSCTRKATINGVYRQTTSLRDVIYDIWNNSNYGLGESLEKLDIRADLNENCNVIFDKQKNGVNTIKELLQGFGYLFYPSESQFVIRKDEAQEITYFNFNDLNSKNSSYKFTIQNEDEFGDGVRISYIKDGEYKLSDFTYPTYANYPKDITLIGVSDSEIATEMAMYFYKRQKNKGKILQIETELEGLTVELTNKVSYTSSYLDSNYAVVAESLEGRVLTLKDNIELKAGIDYALYFFDKEGKRTDTYYLEVLTEDTFSNIFNLATDYGMDFSEQKMCIIGIEDSFTDYYTVEEIEYTEEEDKVKLTLLQYDESIYDN